MITLEQVRNVGISPLVDQLEVLEEAPWVEIRWNKLIHLWTVKTEIDGKKVEGVGISPADAIRKIGMERW